MADADTDELLRGLAAQVEELRLRLSRMGELEREVARLRDELEQERAVAQDAEDAPGVPAGGVVSRTEPFDDTPSIPPPTIAAFHVYWDMAAEELKVYAPPGCLFYHEDEVTIDGADDDDAVSLGDRSGTVWCHVTGEKGDYRATFDWDEDADGVFSFKVATVPDSGYEPFGGEQIASGTLAIGGEGGGGGDTVYNSKVTIYKSDKTTEVGLFTVNQSSDSSIVLPEIPEVSDAKITINKYDGEEVGHFTLNQTDNQTITLPKPEATIPFDDISIGKVTRADAPDKSALQFKDFDNSKSDGAQGLAQRLAIVKEGEDSFSLRAADGQQDVWLVARVGGRLKYIPLTGTSAPDEDERKSRECDHPGDVPGGGSTGGVPAESSDHPGGIGGGAAGGGVPAGSDPHSGEPCPACVPGE